MTLILALGLQACDGPPPSDQQMIDTFKSKRAVFEKLASDLCTLPRPEDIWTNGNSSPALPANKLQGYYALMKQIGVDRAGVIPASIGPPPVRNYPCYVEIDAWSRGFPDGGDSKSWITSPLPNTDGLVLQNLDAIDFRGTVKSLGPGSSHGHRDYLRHLDGKWWLEWDHWE